MSDISFVIGKPVGEEYPSIVKSNVESKGISFDDAWVDYCHEILGRFIDASGENLLNRTLSTALGKNVIAPETFLTYRMITLNGQVRKSPVLMLVSGFCIEQDTEKKVQITKEATQYLSAFLGNGLKVESIEVVVTKPLIDEPIFHNAEEWRTHLFDENIHDCLNAFKNAVENGNESPVVFLIDVRDEFGGILAKSLNGGKDMTQMNTYIATVSFDIFNKVITILEKTNGFELKATKPSSTSDYRSLVAVIAADGISYFDAQI
jgi:hypothetical protein